MKESAEKPINAYKITLSTKRVVLLRELKLKDQNLATKMLGQRKMNQAEMHLAIQENLIKILLMEIDGVKLDHKAKENLDDLFSVKEYGQLVLALTKINSEDEENSSGEAEIETLVI